MTAYCYRCGGPIEVTPKVKTIELWTSGRAKVIFDEEIIEHQCLEPEPLPPPQPIFPRTPQDRT